MVGVPGRSKSCGTCRIRRKGGCDRKRPFCGQCLKLGLKCDGYGRETIFVTSTTRSPPRYRGEAGERQVTLPDTLARSAYEEKYFDIFWRTYLPEKRPFPKHVTRYTNGGWTNTLPQLSCTSQPIRKMMLAVCLTTAGRAENNVWEKQEGLKCYISSLKDMTTALAEPKTATLVTLCVTSRLYGLYEILFGQDDQDRLVQARNWRKHLNGELAVITSQPPEAYASGYLHQLFADGRFHLTTGAIQMRKRTVLSNPEWRDIPWREIPKTPKDFLIDILVDIPKLLEDLDIAKSCRDLEYRKVLELELNHQCWDFEKRLVEWRTQVGITDPVYTLDTSQISFSLDLVAASQIMCLYWAICIIVYRTLYSISDIDTDLPRHTDPMGYCRRIAEAVPVLLHPLSGAYSVHMVGFPIAVSLRYLNGVDGQAGQADSKEKQMILDVFRNSGHGRLVEGFVSSIHANSKSHCRE